MSELGTRRPRYLQGGGLETLLGGVRSSKVSLYPVVQYQVTVFVFVLRGAFNSFLSRGRRSSGSGRLLCIVRAWGLLMLTPLRFLYVVFELFLRNQ